MHEDDDMSNFVPFKLDDDFKKEIPVIVLIQWTKFSMYGVWPKSLMARIF